MRYLSSTEQFLRWNHEGNLLCPELAPEGAHGAYPELLGLGKTEFDGASAMSLVHQKITEIHLVLAQLLKSTGKKIQKLNGLHKPSGEMGFIIFES